MYIVHIKLVNTELKLQYTQENIKVKTTVQTKIHYIGITQTEQIKTAQHKKEIQYGRDINVYNYSTLTRTTAKQGSVSLQLNPPDIHVHQLYTPQYYKKSAMTGRFSEYYGI